MRVLVLAGLITAATVPFAAASETDIIDCQATETRRGVAEQRFETPAQGSPGVTEARPTVAQRAGAPARAERRRGGKPIPDAQLIQPRGAL